MEELTAKDIMRTKFRSLKKGDSLKDAIDVFTKEADMVFPVLDEDGRLIGEVNQREILKLALSKEYLKEGEIMGPSGIRRAMEHYAKNVGDIMDKNNIQVSSDTKISQICKIMTETEVGTVEVIGEGDQPKGIVSELDILRYVKDSILK